MFSSYAEEYYRPLAFNVVVHCSQLDLTHFVLVLDLTSQNNRLQAYRLFSGCQNPLASHHPGEQFLS